MSIEPPARYHVAQQMDVNLGPGMGRRGTLGVGTSECGDRACPTSCPRVAIVLNDFDRWVKLIYPPAVAREIAFDILAAADEQDPAGATARRAS